MDKIKKNKGLFDNISVLIEQARKKVAATINQEMVILYWNIGKTIKKEIIKSDRAEYGKQIVNSLSSQLVAKYGKSFSARNLWFMIQFYEIYPILHALRGEFKELNWTHIRTLLPIKDDLKRQFYSTLCQKERWSTHTLQKKFFIMQMSRK